MDSDLDPPELGRLRHPRSLWRFVGWGSLAAIALTGAALVTQTDVGAQRLQTVIAPLAGTLTQATSQAEIPRTAAPAPQAVAAGKDTTKETEALRLETTRLRAEVRALAADRDRLNARIAGLENGLSDITGSVKRELSLLAATAPATPPPMAERPETVPPRAATADDAPPPADTGRKQDKSQARFESRVEAGSGAETKTETKPDAKAEQRAGSPARWTAIESVPLPPARFAAVPTVAQPDKPGKSNIGIELGGARSMDILNARWLAVKANFGPYIEGMHPLVVHDQRPGINIPFRLIVGPVPNGAVAAQLCQRFAASKVTCRTTRFAGEPLPQP